MARLVVAAGRVATGWLALAACSGDDGGSATGGGTAATSTAGDTASSPTSADDDGADASSTRGDPGSDTAAPTDGPGDTTDTVGGDTTAGGETDGDPLCGNAMLDPGEGCDEPNGIDADGCNEDCTVSGAVLWSHSQAAGLGLTEELFDVVLDDRGNAYVTGAFNNTAAGTDYWVRQYTADGGLGWTVSVDGTAGVADSGRGIVRVGDAVVVAGFVNDVGVSSDWRVGQYALNGMAAWAVGYGSVIGGGDVAQAITADTAGNLFVAGSEATELEGADVVVRQVLPGGAPGWAASYGGAALSTDSALSVAADPTGLVIVAGYETVVAQGRDAWIRAYDAAGSPLWTGSLQGVDALDDMAYGVATDGAGGIFVVGAQGTVAQGSIAWMRRYDAAGAEVWTQTWAGASNEGAVAVDVAVDAAGHVVMVGHETVAGAGSALVRKYDADGNVLWSETYATTASSGNLFRGVTIGAGDQIWVAGGMNLGIDGRDTWVGRIAP